MAYCKRKEVRLGVLLSLLTLPRWLLAETINSLCPMFHLQTVQTVQSEGWSKSRLAKRFHHHAVAADF